MTRRVLILAQPAGLLVYTSVQWLLFLYFVRAGGLPLGGDFALAQAVIAPVFALLSFSLRQVWVTRGGGDLDYGALVIVRLATTCFGILAVLGMVQVAGLNLNPAPFALVLMLKSQETVADIFYAKLDSEGRSTLVGILTMAKGVMLAIAIACGLALPVTTACLLIGAAAAAMLMLEAAITYSMRAKQPIDLGRSMAAILPALRPVAWLSVANLVITVAGFLPRYALELFGSREAVGLFTAVSMPASVVLLICTGLTQASLRDIAAAVRERADPRFRHLGARLLGEMVAVVAVTAFFVWLAGPAMLGLLGSAMDPALAGTMTGVILVYIPVYVAQALSYIFLALRRYARLAAINAAGLALQAALAWPLINLDQIYGAALLIVTVSSVQIAAFGLLLARHFRHEQPAAATG